MTWKPRSLWPLAFLAAAGCGGATAPPTDTSKLISWDQYVKMSAEDQADPYVLNNLDPEAQKKLSERGKKTKK